ncbi:MAG: hypothetical protein PHF81_04525 [Flavobacterium sp.]|nr:hypothetical protein [Flavobacterium sp.]
MIENINFRLLDIDKYLKEIATTYYNIGQICDLPFYERLSNELAVKEYRRFSRRIAKGIITQPLARLTKSEIETKNYYENEIKVLKNALHKVPFLDWFTPDKINTKSKYFYFDTNELETFKPNTDNVYSWINGLMPTMLEVSIDEIENDFVSSPLPKIDYYKNKLSKLKNEEFIYLDTILNGALIEKLDNETICRGFCFEVIKIKEIQYLENKIFELENPQIEAQPVETSTSKLSQKQIALLFQNLSEIGIFNKQKVSQDNSKQAELICLLSGIDCPNKIIDTKFYKYWLSVQSTNDNENVRTKQNYTSILKHAKSIDFKELETKIENDLKAIK